MSSKRGSRPDAGFVCHTKQFVAGESTHLELFVERTDNLIAVDITLFSFFMVC